jgi:GNAT superfamily N-acetyltransferase
MPYFMSDHTPVSISQADRNDLEQILQLQKECYRSEAEIYNDDSIPPLHEGLMSLEKEFENAVILKAVVDGKIVGSVRGCIDNEICRVGKLMVKDEFQNKGMGRLLLEAIETTFPNCKRFELFTGHKSLKNIYLYNKIGYREFKRQPINDHLTMIFLKKIK